MVYVDAAAGHPGNFPAKLSVLFLILAVSVFLVFMQTNFHQNKTQPTQSITGNTGLVLLELLKLRLYALASFPLFRCGKVKQMCNVINPT